MERSHTKRDMDLMVRNGHRKGGTGGGHRMNQYDKI